MQEINDKTKKDILDFISKLNISYNKEADKIYNADKVASDYFLITIIQRINVDNKTNISVDDLKEIMSETKSFEYVNKNDIDFDDIIDIVYKDNNIKEDEWKEYLDWRKEKAIWNIDKDGMPTSLADCFQNITGFIENFPITKGKIKYNNVKNIIEYNGVQITDKDLYTITNYINKYFLPKFSKIKMVKEAIDNVGFKNKYNPWVNYFNKLEYVDDNIDWIEYTIKNVLCCEEQEKYYDLYYETIKIMLLASMSRIYNKELYNKPTKYDIVVTLCGVNGGSGKTTFFDRLFDINDDGNTYCYTVSGDAFKPNDKDFLERSHQCVCLLLDEISMRRSIVTSVKGYITQKDDRFRKSFGYNNEGHMRDFIIVATSNNTDILKDYTTNNERRWAIIKISENIKNYINVNKAFDNGYRDKIWAFIKNIYNKGDFNLYFTDDRIIELEKNIQRGYKASNNEDYNTILNDILEREYGFFDEHSIDVNSIVAQYNYENSREWCIKNNDEYDVKYNKSLNDEYILKPDDRKIMFWGKIDKIQKTMLYNILSKLKIEYTKPSLAAEMKNSGKWLGYDNKPCRIGEKLVKGYWRIDKTERVPFDYNQNSSNNNQLPF